MVVRMNLRYHPIIQLVWKTTRLRTQCPRKIRSTSPRWRTSMKRARWTIIRLKRHSQCWPRPLSTRWLFDAPPRKSLRRVLNCIAYISLLGDPASLKPKTRVKKNSKILSRLYSRRERVLDPLAHFRSTKSYRIRQVIITWSDDSLVNLELTWSWHSVSSRTVRSFTEKVFPVVSAR